MFAEPTVLAVGFGVFAAFFTALVCGCADAIAQIGPIPRLRATRRAKIVRKFWRNLAPLSLLPPFIFAQTPKLAAGGVDSTRSLATIAATFAVARFRIAILQGAVARASTG